MTPHEAAVDIEDLHVTYPVPAGREGVAALQGVTLAVPAGAFVAVVGRSGAGKTTLLRSLTGFVRPAAGRLRVLGVDVARARGRQLYGLRRQTATVYQQFNLVDRATAWDNVLHGRLGHTGTLRSLLGLFSREDRYVAYRTLAELGLAERAQQRVDRLSGGERQRVAIARALVQEPRVILADEPAASLDLSLTRLVLSVLQQWNRERGTTVIANIHHVELAKTFATRIVGLQQGRLVFDGPPAALTPAAQEVIYHEPQAPARTGDLDTRQPRPAAAEAAG